METVKITDGREDMFAAAEPVSGALGRWRIRFDTGRTVDTDATADVMGRRTTLRVRDLPALRRESAAQARGERQGGQREQHAGGHRAERTNRKPARVSGAAKRSDRAQVPAPQGGSAR